MSFTKEDQLFYDLKDLKDLLSDDPGNKIKLERVVEYIEDVETKLSNIEDDLCTVRSGIEEVHYSAERIRERLGL